MDKKAVLERITATGLIPVIRARSVDEAAQVVDAIQAGGLSVLEITMTVPDAVALIRELTKRGPRRRRRRRHRPRRRDRAGLHRRGRPLRRQPGPRPRDDQGLPRRRRRRPPGRPHPHRGRHRVEGRRRPGEGVSLRGPWAGRRYIKSLKAPLPQIDLVPTGGVSLQTAKAFLKAGASALGVGADLVDLAALRERQRRPRHRAREGLPRHRPRGPRGRVVTALVPS